ncbi:uncharacterized protein MONBRDRAFT_7402 [Monosiga brevicollis MX1]|uniref:Helicase C-terminal domain-containing protein n=1 Tax=Monosiga brevicollis TaxID=81824 RepID=A9UWV4_MONBE|nr:uncharacterized protein MONBRDRAFT_7402 [Monosiga brevicollis MX1]EDQ90108.1 predicted protein [Monosiga brevicollis MX1]|eukprot:XP_001744875.1 hypothetical protein [Monosiga brevicollis MX1]
MEPSPKRTRLEPDLNGHEPPQPLYQTAYLDAAPTIGIGFYHVTCVNLAAAPQQLELKLRFVLSHLNARGYVRRCPPVPLSIAAKLRDAKRQGQDCHIPGDLLASNVPARALSDPRYWFSIPGVLKLVENSGYRAASQPRNIDVTLHEYQLQTLAWMIDQEKDPLGLNGRFWEQHVILRPNKPWCRIGPQVHSFWQSEVTEHWNNFDEDVLKTVQTLLGHIMMRHSKSQTVNGRPIITLPRRTVVEVPLVYMTSSEEYVYKYLEERVIQLCRQPHSGRNLLVAFNRLLLFCSHAANINLRQFGMDLGVAKQSERRFRLVSELAQHTGLDNVLLNTLLNNNDWSPARALEAAGYTREQASNILTRLSNVYTELSQMMTPATFLRTVAPHATASASNALEMIGHLRDGSVPVSLDIDFDAPYHKTAVVVTEPSGRILDSQEAQLWQPDESFVLKLRHRADVARALPGAKVTQAVAIMNKVLAQDPRTKFVVFASVRSLAFDLMHLETFRQFFWECISRLEPPLEPSQLEDYLIDGATTAANRSHLLHEFKTAEDMPFLLLSTKANNAGLTLTVANHIIMLDAILSPGVEAQLINRVHRIGQSRPVTIHKYVDIKPYIQG